MNLDDLQDLTENTAIYRGADAIEFYMLGLAGEVGSLLSTRKKSLRDNEGSIGSKNELEKEIGDILWYVTQIANELNISLAECVARVHQEAAARWLPPSSAPQFLDESAPVNQQLPRRFVAEFRGVQGKAEMTIDGEIVGDSLSDNSHRPDEYRFHDVFHLAHAAVLGWSPVLRSILGRKRKYDADIDEVEDGARAIFVEEGLTAFIFGQACSQDYFATTERIETWILNHTIRSVGGLEVACRTPFEWEQAILAGYKAWRRISSQGGGSVVCDLSLGTIVVES